MSKHMVTCMECGRQFDANKGGYYYKDQRRYKCKRCEKNSRANARERSTGMRQSFGGMIAKIAIGVLFVCTGFSSPEGGWSIGYFMTALIIGCALIAWGFLPYLRAKKKKKAPQISVESISLPKTCPYCGATTTGSICEYCGKPV